MWMPLNYILMLIILFQSKINNNNGIPIHICKSDVWKNKYINKYVNGYRFEVTKGIGYNDKVFELADQGL